jgi:hypothetical protein
VQRVCPKTYGELDADKYTPLQGTLILIFLAIINTSRKLFNNEHSNYIFDKSRKNTKYKVLLQLHDIERFNFQ